VRHARSFVSSVGPAVRGPNARTPRKCWNPRIRLGVTPAAAIPASDMAAMRASRYGYVGASVTDTTSSVVSDTAGSLPGNEVRVSSSGREFSEAVSEATVEGCCCAWWRSCRLPKPSSAPPSLPSLGRRGEGVSRRHGHGGRGGGGVEPAGLGCGAEGVRPAHMTASLVELVIGTGARGGAIICCAEAGAGAGSANICCGCGCGCCCCICICGALAAPEGACHARGNAR
jgi:hypothetical protein